MTKSPTKVICDAGPILHLDELNCLDLLADFDTIMVPMMVEKEIMDPNFTIILLDTPLK